MDPLKHLKNVKDHMLKSSKPIINLFLGFMILSNPVSGHEWSSDVLEWWPLNEMGLKLYTEVDGDFRDECEVMGRVIEKKIKSSAELKFGGTEGDSLATLVLSYHALCWPSRFNETKETLK